MAFGKPDSVFCVVKKYALDADIVSAARGLMRALGCVQTRACNTQSGPAATTAQNSIGAVHSMWKTDLARGANFQCRTLDFTFELIGVMGQDNPDDIVHLMHWRSGANETEQLFDVNYPLSIFNVLLVTIFTYITFYPCVMPLRRVLGPKPCISKAASVLAIENTCCT